MAKLKTDREYVRALEDCKAHFETIINELKSINAARKLADDAIGEINEFLYASDREEVLQRIRFAIKRGHQPNPEDIESLLNIAEDIL